mgnify:CR=1 FL=1
MTQGTLFTGLPALAVRAGLSYAAWTQIIPAVLVWFFAIMMLAALWLVGMDARGENPAAGMESLVQRFPGLTESLGGWYEARVAPHIEAATDPETGAVHLDQIDFWGAASWIWFWLSLIGALFGFLWRRIFGPGPTRSLLQKLAPAVGACVVLAIAFSAVLVSFPPDFQSGGVEWFAISTSAGFIVLIVTSWSVAVAHGLGKLADAIAPQPQPANRTG